MAPRRSPAAYLSEFLLLLVGLVWGGTFPVIKIAIETTGALWFNAYRFIIAALLSLLILILLRRKPGADMLRYSVILGTLLAIGYTTQTVGLKYTTSGKAGFITGLFVVFVPLISSLVFKKRPGNAVIASIALGVVGLSLLSLNNDLTISRGDPIVLMCAIAYAIHIVIVDNITDRFDTLELTLNQIVVAGVEMFVLAYLVSPEFAAVDTYSLTAIIFTAVVATIGAFFIQIFAQKHIGPSRTALILLSEPLFAAIFGYLLLQEVLAGRRLFGAVLLFTAMVVAEVYGKEKQPTD